MVTSNRALAPLRHLGLFLRMLVRQFSANQGVLNAAALTYTTLFAVVPLMTVTYSMLASIPSFQGVGEQLEGVLFDHFVPSSGESIRGYLSEFASQARSLTVVGVGFLVVTAFMMLKSVEAAFNRIWQVDRPRKGLSSFLIYWAVLSLGPLLLGLGFVLTSYLVSLPLISDASAIIGGQQRLLTLLPLVTSAAAFTLLYAAVPNCTVPVRHALVGGLVVALLFEAAKRGFTLFVANSPSYQLVYGAFAAVPLFLAWIYISWMIVLLGAELVRGLSTFSPQQRASSHDPYYWILRLLEQLWRAQQCGEARSAEQLRQPLPGLPAERCGSYLQHLQTAGLVVRTDQGLFALNRDLSCFTVNDLTRQLPWPLPEQLVGLPSEWGAGLPQRLDQLAEERRRCLDLPLAHLYEPTDGEPAMAVSAPQRSGVKV